MFESIINFFKNLGKKDQEPVKSKDAAKERLHLVLMQDRANVSADFLDLMKQEIIEVIKKYIDVDENSIDVRLTNKTNSDGTTGAPALYANIPIVSIKDDVKSKIARENDEKAEHIIPESNTKIEEKEQEKEEEKVENKIEDKTVEQNNEENKTAEPQIAETNNVEEVKHENNVEEQTRSEEPKPNAEEVNKNEGDTSEEQNS